jgi:sphingomyelin phosphodiesterase 2
VLNTWRWPKSEQKKLGPGKEYVHVPGDTLDPKGYRLDYIFASSGARDGLAGGWIVKEARVGMTERHPTLQCSVSDHFSVECTLQYHQDGHMSNQGTPTLTDKDAVNSGAFLSSPANSLYGAQMKNLEETSYLPIPTYDEILEVIEAYTIRERKQRRYRLYHFIVSLLISIACFIGVWWSPHNYVAFILMLISTLGLSAGVIDGLIGGLFVGSEIRALKEFEWEVRNTRAAAGGETGGDMEAYEAVKDW